MATRTAVIVGALGVIGRNLLLHLEADADWRIIGLVAARAGFHHPGTLHRGRSARS